MSGVWVFDKNGVARLITNPTKESFEQKDPKHPGTATAPGARPRVLVYLPSNQVIRSYTELEQRLTELGWTRYHDSDPDSDCSELIQFHRSDTSSHLISLPRSFSNFKHFHLYDIVVKNRAFFQVRDPTTLYQAQTTDVNLKVHANCLYFPPSNLTFSYLASEMSLSVPTTLP